MTLILSNEEIESVFTIEECFSVLEPAFLDLGSGKAVNMPRQDLLVPGPLEGSYHGLKVSSGSLPRAGVAAVRLTSDIVTWPTVGGEQRRVKVPTARGKFVGLVLLFSTETGEPLAIFPDGFIQALRVGVTNALSAKHMARADSSILALYGSGWQAGPGLLAMAAVLPIREVRVFSPTRENREKFVGQMKAKVTAEIYPVSQPEEAAKDADVVVLATNALKPFFPAAWMRDGMHLTTVRSTEMTLDALLRCDVIAVSSRQQATLLTLDAEREKIPELGSGDYSRDELKDTKADWRDKPELGEIIAGKARGRIKESDVTCMLNFIGLGLQFAAAGARVYELAKEKGLGREIPTEWLSEDVHP
jgi:ornithine cyclodeaminase/alanine dehydrogenase-like protein (mu-crystallin family)